MPQTELMTDRKGESGKGDQSYSPVSGRKVFKGHSGGRKVVPSGLATMLISLGLDSFQICFQFYCLEESPGNKSWVIFFPLQRMS